MSESEGNEKVMVGRFYASARKFKRRIGALPDGTKIWGGPYTYTQVGVMGMMAAFGWLTKGIWGFSSTLTQGVVVLVVAYGAGLIAGKAPQGKRSLLSLISSALTLARHPGVGRNYQGRPMRLSAQARKIQQQQKQHRKHEAKNENRAASQPQAPEHETPPPAGYGSSLNRLLHEHGLEPTMEGKQSW